MRGLVLDVGGVLVGPGSEPGTFAAIVSFLRKRGVRTALLSNDPGGPAAQWLRDLEGPFVDCVVLSGDVGVAKPQAASYHAVAQLLGLEPGECVFVDDLFGHVRAAAAAGMVGVHHDGSHDVRSELAVLFDFDLGEIDTRDAGDAGPWWRGTGSSDHEGERGRWRAG
ncbi:HAD-IA family hydrolase [Rhodococcus sp. NPDC047139]|uniref:HAD-IA family hydrolase n=1 Tax=Rhodococcus sp. NPDC047139 TaxID=3155141 RepID=UPI0033EE117A